MPSDSDKAAFDASSAASDWPSLEVPALHELRRYLVDNASVGTRAGIDELLPSDAGSNDGNFVLSVANVEPFVSLNVQRIEVQRRLLESNRVVSRPPTVDLLSGGGPKAPSSGNGLRCLRESHVTRLNNVSKAGLRCMRK